MLTSTQINSLPKGSYTNRHLNDLFKTQGLGHKQKAKIRAFKNHSGVDRIQAIRLTNGTMKYIYHSK